MMQVLIVDDSITTRSFVRSMIEEVGDFDIYEASSGFEAIRLLPQYSFSLVITDINMPDMNGFELINFIKGTDRYKHIPVVFISTERGEEEIQKGISLGAFAYVTKPFQAEDFQDIIKKALGL